MEKQIPVYKALEITIDILNGISVPVSLMEQIGVPISRAVNNLAQCVEAILRDSEKAKDEAEFVDAGFEEKKEDFPKADKVIEVTGDGNSNAE